jgi:hypothetical protein
MLAMPPFRLMVDPRGGILHASHASHKATVMKLQIRQPLLSLDTGQVVTLDDAAGTRIVTRSGTVWVTEEGTPQDHIVEGGHSFVVAQDGRTLVQALAPSVVALQ